MNELGRKTFNFGRNKFSQLSNVSRGQTPKLLGLLACGQDIRTRQLPDFFFLVRAVDSFVAFYRRPTFERSAILSFGEKMVENNF